MATSIQAAVGVSQRLVEQAIAHIDSFLEDETWLKERRQLGTADRTFAYWVLPGIGMLTDGEKDRVREAYADKGWRNVIFFTSCGGPQDPDTNWSVEFQAMP